MSAMVTKTTLINHLFKWSQMHLCVQRMLNGFLDWKLIEELFHISQSPISEDLFGYIPGLSTTSMQPRNSPGADERLQQTSPEMLINKLSEKREASHLHTICKHPLIFMCLTHKR